MTFQHQRHLYPGTIGDPGGPSAAPRRPRARRWRFAAVSLLAGAAWRLSAQSAPAGSPVVAPIGGSAAAPASPQDSATAAFERFGPGSELPGAAEERLAVPFGPGERLTYEVRFGVLKVGTGEMEVHGVTTLRGREAYHTRFRVRGGTFFYKVDDRFESWFTTGSLASLRFKLDQNEGRRERERNYEIFPERQTYREGEKPEEPSVADPLDEGSFLYYVRTLPLRTGDVYEVNRYFRPDRNPVRIRVVRRERVTVPAGTFNAVVVQPTIRTRGIFSEGGRAEVWLSDDEDRVVLQMKSQLSFGSLNLFLRNKQPGRRLAP